MPRGRRKGGGSKGSVAGALAGLRAYRDLLLSRQAAIEERLSAINEAMSGLDGGEIGGADVGGGSAARRGPGRPPGRGPGRRPGRPAGSKGRAGGGKGRGRHGPREGSLKQYALNALRSKGAVMTVKDITSAVRNGGYKTKNKTLDKSVGIGLVELVKAGLVSKVGRGKFKARG